MLCLFLSASKCQFVLMYCLSTSTRVISVRGKVPQRTKQLLVIGRSSYFDFTLNAFILTGVNTEKLGELSQFLPHKYIKVLDFCASCTPQFEDEFLARVRVRTIAD